MNKKRMLSILLVIATMLSFAGGFETTAAAAEVVASGEWWSGDTSDGEIFCYHGSSLGAAWVEWSLDSDGVLYVDQISEGCIVPGFNCPWESGGELIGLVNTIVIGPNVECLGNGLFMYLDTVRHVDMSNAVALTAIGGEPEGQNSSTFTGKITTIDFSGCVNLEYLGSFSFDSTSIVNLDLSACEELKYIGWSAFLSSSITGLILPETNHFISIENYAFYDIKAEHVDLSGEGNINVSMALGSFRAETLQTATVNIDTVYVSDGDEDAEENTFGAWTEVIVYQPPSAEAPTITEQPEGFTTTVGESGNTLSVTATVEEGELSYQWYSNTTNSNEGGTAIEGATGATYEPPTDEESTTYYYCEVTNTDDSKVIGTATTKTVVVEVVVDALPVPEPSVFSVTVPTSLPLTLKADGSIEVASDAEITNYSNAPVEVKSITLDGLNGWSFVDYNGGDNSIMAGMKVDSNKCGFYLSPSSNQGIATSQDGDSETFSALGSEWIIAKEDVLPLSYDAILTAVKDPISAQSIGQIVFTIGFCD